MPRPKVYVTRRIPEEGLAILRQAADIRIWEADEPVPREVLRREVADIDGLLPLVTDRIDGEIMDAAGKLRVIGNYAVGYDNIDVPAATQRGILVTNTPGVLTDATADLAFALLLATARRVVEGDRYMREGRWKAWGPLLLLGAEVHGATLGLIGLGRIGQAVAARAKGFRMRILYSDVQRNLAAEAELGLEYTDLAELLGTADFVSVHVPLTPATQGMLGAQEFRLMKRSAILINTSRGPVIREEELAAALRDGVIAGAGLDVFAEEPLPAASPLYAADNLVLVPHIGSASSAARRAMAVMAAENIVTALQGKLPPNLVNRELTR